MEYDGGEAKAYVIVMGVMMGGCRRGEGFRCDELTHFLRCLNKWREFVSYPTGSFIALTIATVVCCISSGGTLKEETLLNAFGYTRRKAGSQDKSDAFSYDHSTHYFVIRVPCP
jgi:hypothetical protein